MEPLTDTPEAWPRIRPEHALRGTRADAWRLLTVWYLRKSVYIVAALGILGAVVAGRVEELEIDVSPERFVDQLWSPVAGAILAILIRVTANSAGLLLAWPLTRAYEEGLAPRTNIGKSIGTWFDRLHLARAFRSLRWTHHVRQLALARLGPLGRRLGRLDPIMDVTSIVLWVIAVLAVLVRPPA